MKGAKLTIVANTLLATAIKPILIADNNLVVPTADIIKAEYAEESFRNKPYNIMPLPTTVSNVPKAVTSFIIPPINSGYSRDKSRYVSTKDFNTLTRTPTGASIIVIPSAIGLAIFLKSSFVKLLITSKNSFK